MATKNQQARRTTSRLSAGFDTLTLDPSSRLRERREAMSQTDPLIEAWQTVTQALTQATRSIFKSFRTKP